MNDELIYKKKFLCILSLVVLGLFFLSGYLYSDNKSYREKNSQLILQNDSLLSVNLRLKTDSIKIEQLGYTKQGVYRNPKRYE